jgi:DMSO/TMAO reductase YedYZ heme-binding membrane subunit
MAAGAAGTARAAAWQRVPVGDDAVAVAERAALGTSARVVVWPPGNLDPACAAVNNVLAALDLQASRFRPDSELSWLNAARGGLFLLGDGLAEAVGVALAAARWTGGLTDPTVGDALVSLGYDRDFAAIAEDGEPPRVAVPAPGWRLVRLDGPVLRLPTGIRLDLGATAKGVGADRAVRAVMSANGSAGGVLVSLGVAARLGPGSRLRLAAGELHRTLALFCVAFLGLHVVTAILDPYVWIGWAATVLPLASPYRALDIGLGALAADLGGAVLVTSLVRRRLGYRAWRAVHWLAYLSWPAAFGHAVTAGNDLRVWWAALVLWGCAAAVATAVIARLLAWLRGPGLPDRAVPAEGALR